MTTVLDYYDFTIYSGMHAVGGMVQYLVIIEGRGIDAGVCVV